MVRLDGFTAFGGIAVFTVTGIALLGMWPMVPGLGRRGAELLALVLLSAMGLHLMAASGNLIMLFVALEIASISLYVIAGFTRERADADEAAMKYFLLGSFASAVFLYGIA
ncbi:MAG: NADH-quinone oxidoreductase subunit N, partial [Acidimicrobiia bacterium]|nr:NADH-quinone oxidoreductase subunit N [Acidimicrobiia bacterium]